MARTPAQDGFSIVEVMTAITVFGLVAGGLAAGMVTASTRLGASRVDSQADSVATSELESIRRLAYGQIGLTGGNPSGILPATATKTVNGVNYAVTREVRFINNPTPGAPPTHANWKRVTIRVTPPRANAQPATKTTFISPPSIDAVVGKSAIRVTIRRADTLAGIPNIPLTLDSGPSPLRTDISGDPTGRATFANLEPNPAVTSDPAYYYRLTAPVPGLLTSRRSSRFKHVAPNQVVDMIMDYFQGITVAVRLQDADTGAPIPAANLPRVFYYDSFYDPVLPPVARATFKEDLVPDATGAVNFVTLEDGLGLEPNPTFESKLTSTASCYENGESKRIVATTIPSGAPWVFSAYKWRSLTVTALNGTGSALSGQPVTVEAMSGTVAGLPRTGPTTNVSGQSTTDCVPPSTPPHIPTTTEHHVRVGGASGYAVSYFRMPVPSRQGPVGGTPPGGPPTLSQTIRLWNGAVCNMTITGPSGTENRPVNIQSQSASATYDRNLTLNSSRQATYSAIPSVNYVARVWNGTRWLVGNSTPCVSNYNGPWT